VNAPRYPLADLSPVPEIDDVLRRAMRAPYLARRRFLRFRIPTRPPRFLYQFRSLRPTENRKLTDPAFAEQSIERLRLLIVHSLIPLFSPETFNDPFDTEARWFVAGTVEERRAKFNALVTTWQPPRTTDEQREQALQRMLTATDAELAALLKGSFATVRRDFGIACFAAGDPRDVLMWSHYANNHSGVCLQFEAARDLLVLMRAVSIDYIDEYPSINWLLNQHNGINLTLTRKHSRWAYEREHRILLHGCAGQHIRFEPNALTGIILGCRAGEDARATVRDLLAERVARGMPEVTVYEAYRHELRYELKLRRAALR
jgi:DUF2971 family protein